jgi:phosphatidate phosphatase PAH1
MEPWIAGAIAGVISLLFWGITIFLIRKWFTEVKVDVGKVNTKLDGVIASQHDCREELPERFAGKDKTEKNVAKIYDRLDKQGQDISNIRGRMNGAARATG